MNVIKKMVRLGNELEEHGREIAALEERIEEHGKRIDESVVLLNDLCLAAYNLLKCPIYDEEWYKDRNLLLTELEKVI